MSSWREIETKSCEVRLAKTRCRVGDDTLLCPIGLTSAICIRVRQGGREGGGQQSISARLYFWTELIESLENVLTVLRLGWESRKKLPILLFWTFRRPSSYINTRHWSTALLQPPVCSCTLCPFQLQISTTPLF